MAIVCNIIEARIINLIKKREDAIRKKDYERAWILDMRITKNMNRLVTNSY